MIADDQPETGKCSLNSGLTVWQSGDDHCDLGDRMMRHAETSDGVRDHQRSVSLIWHFRIARNPDKIGDNPIDTEQRFKITSSFEKNAERGNVWPGRRRHNANPSLVTRKPNSNCVRPSVSRIRLKKAIPQTVA
jgi:hypothetical protein